jgi:hypothetical protein
MNKCLSVLNTEEQNRYDALMLKVGAIYGSFHPTHAEKLEAKDFTHYSFFYYMPDHCEALEDDAVFDVVKEISKKVKRVTEEDKVKRLAHKDCANLKLGQLIEQEKIFEELEEFRAKFAEAAKTEESEEVKTSYDSLEKHTSEVRDLLKHKLASLKIIESETDKETDYKKLYKAVLGKDPELIDSSEAKEKFMSGLIQLDQEGHIDIKDAKEEFLESLKGQYINGESDEAVNLISEMKAAFVRENQNMLEDFNTEYPGQLENLIRSFFENLLTEILNITGVKEALPQKINWDTFGKNLKIKVRELKGYFASHAASIGKTTPDGKVIHNATLEINPPNFTSIFQIITHELLGHHLKSASTDALIQEGKVPREVHFLAVGTSVAAGDCGFADYFTGFLKDMNIIKKAMQKTLAKYPKVNAEKAIAMTELHIDQRDLSNIALHNCAVLAHCEGKTKQEVTEIAEKDYLIKNPRFIEAIFANPDHAISILTGYANAAEAHRFTIERPPLATLVRSMNAEGLTNLKTLNSDAKP